MTALEHLRDSYNAMKVEKTLENADEILTRAESALRQAEKRYGARTGDDGQDSGFTAAIAKAAAPFPRGVGSVWLNSDGGWWLIPRRSAWWTNWLPLLDELAPLRS
jgi:hypothetical protein